MSVASCFCFCFFIIKHLIINLSNITLFISLMKLLTKKNPVYLLNNDLASNTVKFISEPGPNRSIYLKIKIFNFDFGSFERQRTFI